MSAVTRFYSAWFCPFAQRAWIGLVYKNINFEYIEQDPYDKTPDWLAVNPRGLVPTILHNGKAVYDSYVCLEYIDEVWPERPLMPKDPYERAKIRIWCDHVSKKLVPPYYAMLLKKNQGEREACKNDIMNNLLLLIDTMDKEGPFFSGKDLCLVDLMLIPFAWRYSCVLPYYRQFRIPEDDSRYDRYRNWYRAMMDLDCVKQTCPPEDKLIGSYKRYEDDTAKTLVADAIRAGKTLP